MVEEGVTGRANGTHQAVDEVNSTSSKLQQLGGVNSHEHVSIFVQNSTITATVIVLTT